MIKNLGLLVGLQSEAKLLLKYADMKIGVAGGDPQHVQQIIEQFVQAQVKGIISFGFAGGLDPAIPVGGIIIPSSIITVDRQSFETHGEWRQKVKALLNKVETYSEPLFGANHAITSSNEKKALFHQFGTVAVDMESGTVAKICHQNNIPFIVLRVVLDPATTSLAKEIADTMQKNGQINLTKLLKAIIRQPTLIKELLNLAKQFFQARHWLNHIARLSRFNFAFNFS